MTNRLGPYELNTIVTGDARELAEAIPDNSVDLIFTDPVYQNIEDYEWLARTAARVLKLNGNALAFVNAKWHGPVSRVVPPEHEPLCCVQTSGPSPMNGRIIAKTYYLLWWGSGKLVGYMPDGYIGTTWSVPDIHNFKWTKNPKYIAAVLNAFTEAGCIVADFFCGGGTIPAVCKMLGVNYWACEIDPATAARARMRVLLTQPPLFILEPEQIAMDLAA